MAQLVHSNCTEDGTWKCDEATAETVTLDDLTRLPELVHPIKSAILKIDIEGQERETIMASKTFWEEINVSIFMKSSE